MLFDIPENFVAKLTEKYDYAYEHEHVVFNGKNAVTEIAQQKVGESTSIDIEYTLLTTEKVVIPDRGTVEKNPFSKPEPELTILDKFGPHDEFKIVFNKYPLVARHFMMVTHQFKPQQTPLSSDELGGIYTILAKLKSDSAESENDWFAFYNCGPQSGASQPHKHAQFMMLPPRDKFTPFADEIASKCTTLFIPNDKQGPLQDSLLPFAHFVARLPDDINEVEADDLSMYFGALLLSALTVIKENDVDHVSYNVVMTTKYMMVVPRHRNNYKDGKFGLNSCGFMGLFLCREKEHLEMCKEIGPHVILSDLGFPRVEHDHSEEFKY